MRRSPANSTNRSLAAFGKLQHIQTRAVKALDAKWRLALTGLPGVTWSIRVTRH